MQPSGDVPANVQVFAEFHARKQEGTGECAGIRSDEILKPRWDSEGEIIEPDPAGFASSSYDYSVGDLVPTYVENFHLMQPDLRFKQADRPAGRHPRRGCPVDVYDARARPQDYLIVISAGDRVSAAGWGRRR